MKKINLRFATIVLMILAAVFSRLIPHPPNFAPIGAIALFGGAYFVNRFVAFFIPLVAIWLSDLVINNTIYANYYNGFTWFHKGFYWTYGAIVLTVIIGFFISKKIKTSTVFLSATAASVLFFLISNFSCWPGNPLYTQNFNGLLNCYAAGIPFFKGTLMGNLFYSTLLFGVFEWSQQKIPQLRLQTS
jgi:hypothetical protein